MTKTINPIEFEYHYSPIDHKGAPYSLDGEHWFNGGELHEIADKAVRGLKLAKDANTPYDKGSDIEETKTSVKSSKATLVNKVLGYDFDSTKAMYFNTCHSTNWDWVVILDDTIIIYNMDRIEFENFLIQFSKFDNDRKVIRFKSTSSKMVKWLDEQI